MNNSSRLINANHTKILPTDVMVCINLLTKTLTEGVQPVEDNEGKGDILLPSNSNVQWNFGAWSL